MAQERLRIRLTARDQTRAAFASIQSSFRRTQAAASGLKSTIVALLGAVALGGLARKIVEVNRTFDRMRGVITTLTGDTKLAEGVFKDLQTLARTMPSTLEDLTRTFTRLTGLGIAPTEKRLKTLADIAAALGVPITQFAEAVADAATFEFERLKEFGIRASKEGNKIRLRFRGLERTVDATADAVSAALFKIAEVNFGGAAEEQAKRLTVALSNLKDASDLFLVAIGDAGLAAAIADTARKIAGMADANGALARSIADVLSPIVRAIPTAIAVAVKAMQKLQDNSAIALALLAALGGKIVLGAVTTLGSRLLAVAGAFVVVGKAATLLLGVLVRTPRRFITAILGIGIALVTLSEDVREVAAAMAAVLVAHMINAGNQIGRFFRELGLEIRQTVLELFKDTPLDDTALTRALEDSIAEIKEKLKEPLKDIKELKDRMQADMGDFGKETFAAVRKGIENTIDRFKKFGDIVGVELLEQLDAFQSKIKQTILDFAGLDGAVESNTDKIGENLKKLREYVAELRRSQNEAIVTAQAQKSLADRYKETFPELAKLASETIDYKKAVDNLASRGLKSLEDAFVDLGSQTKSVGEVLRDFARNVLQEVIRAVIRATIIRGIASAVLGVFSGGTGNIGPTGATFAQELAGGFRPLAKGGQGSGPTLVGEEGPELLNLGRTSRVHNNRDTQRILEGGGGGEQIVVQQTINVYGDNPEATRAQVMNMMPTIVKATKSAVQDGKRRGGQFAQTLGKRT